MTSGRVGGPAPAPVGRGFPQSHENRSGAPPISPSWYGLVVGTDRQQR
ncbi:hypothetical protein DUI70_4057 [Streptomyces albus]|nr:hypothetical protein DUI70_4057 [Streptomyces albus]